MVQGEPLRGVLVSECGEGECGSATIKDCLEEFYHILDCDTIDITYRAIGGRVYDIVCDDEGALKEGRVPSAIDSDKRIILYGNLFIVRGNEETGELESLTDEDVENIFDHIKGYIKDGRVMPLLVFDTPYGILDIPEGDAETEDD